MIASIKNWKVLAIGAAMCAAAVTGQAVFAQTRAPARAVVVFDPFQPAAAPAPVIEAPAVIVLPDVAEAATRPPTRDPQRAPARSVFRI